MKLLVASLILVLSLPALANYNYCAAGIIRTNERGGTNFTCTVVTDSSDCSKQYPTGGIVTSLGNNTQYLTFTQFAGHCESTSCFSKDTMVYRVSADGETNPVAITQLSPGDFVLDGDGQRTEFLGYLHADAQQKSRMLEFYSSEDDNAPFLRVSPDHILFVDGMGSQFASDIDLGQSLIHAETGKSIKVGMIMEVDTEGVYAPLTASGTLAVGTQKVKASCFAHTNSPVAASWYFYLKRQALGRKFLDSKSPTETDLSLLGWLRWFGLSR